MAVEADGKHHRDSLTTAAARHSSSVARVSEDMGVARFKFPERLVLVDDLPATKVGKIDKKALRADIARRLAK